MGSDVVDRRVDPCPGENRVGNLVHPGPELGQLGPDLDLRLRRPGSNGNGQQPARWRITAATG